jgi:arogenate dehydrogenase (NADP+)
MTRRTASLLLILTLGVCGVTAFATMSSSTNNSNSVHINNDSSSPHPTRVKIVKMAQSDGNDESSSSLPSVGQRKKQNKDGIGKLEELKKKEAELARLLSAVRKEKLTALRSRPLTIGVVGFGRFGQFIARTFAKHGRVVVTSRSDYTDIAEGMGVTYVPLSDPASFLAQGLDVIVVAVSILSFDDTVRSFVTHIQADIETRLEGGILPGPLVVDVLSVKEHPRQVLLDLLPPECDILCTHPMFGPDSGKNGWHQLNFVYERTRVDGVIIDPTMAQERSFHHPLGETTMDDPNTNHDNDSFVDSKGGIHNIHENSDAHIEGMDRMERFLSIWEEEGCRMVAMSCREHDAYAANSQFITHLMGRILGEQGLKPTPIDTRGFESVLKLVDTTTTDSFDLFYGLYKYNQNSLDTINKLRDAMEGVVQNLRKMEKEDK